MSLVNAGNLYNHLAIPNQICNPINMLDLSFLPAREEIIGSDQRGWEYINHPDLIRFSYNPELIEKVESLGSSVFHEEASHLSPEYYALSASDYVQLFQGIEAVQKEDKSRLCVDFDSFTNVMAQLYKREIAGSDREFLLPSGEGAAQLDLVINKPLKEFEDETIASRNVHNAILLANHYHKHFDIWNEEKAIDWLVKAKTFLGEKSLAEYVDLDKFFQKFNTVHIMHRKEVFKPEAKEILEAMARAPSIKKLYISPFMDFNFQLSEQIGFFIKNSISLETLALGSTWSATAKRLNSNTIYPIAKALEKNKSLKSIDFSDTHIGDEGVLEIINALKRNPDNQVRKINFFCCGMTNKSAKVLLEFFKENKKITWVNVKYNGLTALTENFKLMMPIMSSDFSGQENLISIKKFLVNNFQEEALRLHEAGGIVSEDIESEFEKIIVERNKAEDPSEVS